ncbi:MAG: ABC transporter ATP-binding protein [Candidatus Methanomethylophilaceae archaeon]
MDTVIEAENLVRVFKRKKMPDKTAVDNLSFEVKRGEIFGLLGPNGAGKTTTVKMLSTLLTPTSGSARVLGYDISDERTMQDLRRRINTVSGGERGLYYRLSAKQNLEFFADLYGIPKKEQKDLFENLLEEVGLTEAADIKVENYSRGMKQRLHIARSLVNDPEVLFLDEPTIGLDPEISREIRKMIKSLSESGTAIVLTSHYMYEVEELCDRMIVISNGKTVGSGTAAEIKESVSDPSAVHVVTERDPSDAVSSLRADNRISFASCTMAGGRYVVRYSLKSGIPDLKMYEYLFEPYGIRSIGIDEITLEDAYIKLTGGSP